jgi:hypothetical protein
MEVETPYIAVDGRASIELAIMEAFIERYLKFSHLKF